MGRIQIKGRQNVAERETITLSREDMLLIIKALDVYAYGLYASGGLDELHELQILAKRLIRTIPKAELDS